MNDVNVVSQVTCPRCGSLFSLSLSEYDSLAAQVRTKEFDAELKRRVDDFIRQYEAAKDAEFKAICDKIRSDAELCNQKIVSDLRDSLSAKERELQDMQSKLEKSKLDHELQLMRTIQSQKEESDRQIRDLEVEVAYYKDLKSRMSTKMIGESLEQHCLTQFNQIRMTAFPHAYFEKDNDAKTGSKGDFIYRESADGVELLSIMFEMKNEMDTTATKHHNEDFFKELDKDRREKGCEYAILVSLLESDSELYNQGIVDVSYRYKKMYVVRPQFFIMIITLLRNAALKSLDARRELVRVQNMNLDVVRFEEDLNQSKDQVAKNYDLVNRQFDQAMDEIDKSIEHLQKVKKALASSSRNIRLLNDKVDRLTIQALTKNNPTMREAFVNAGINVV